MACFAVINVSQGNVATYAKCGGTLNIRLTRNLLRNLAVKKFYKSVKVWQNYSESVAQFFGPSCRCLSTNSHNGSKSLEGHPCPPFDATNQLPTAVWRVGFEKFKNNAIAKELLIFYWQRWINNSLKFSCVACVCSLGLPKSQSIIMIGISTDVAGEYVEKWQYVW